MAATLTGAGRWGNQDASVLVISKLVTAAFTPVASRRVEARRVGATVMQAGCTSLCIHTTLSNSMVPR